MMSSVGRSSTSSVNATDTHPRAPLEETKRVTFGPNDTREFYKSDPPSFASSPLIDRSEHMRRYLQEQLTHVQRTPASSRTVQSSARRIEHRVQIRPEVAIHEKPLWKRIADSAAGLCAISALPSLLLAAFIGPIGLVAPAGLLTLAAFLKVISL